MNRSADYIVIGGGIAGAAAAYGLSETGAVMQLERESAIGYHSTGRSAAQLTVGQGTVVKRALAAASRAFFLDPPAGFADHPLIAPRSSLAVAGPGEQAALDAACDAARRDDPEFRKLAMQETLALCPMLRPETVIGGLYTSSVFALDVHALLHGYIHAARARGAQLLSDAEVTGLERRDGVWQVTTKAGRFNAPIVVNAAGAWADVIAEMAGVAPLGLTPKRRTVIGFEAPADFDLAAMPSLRDLETNFYCNSEAGMLMASPADETPSAPCDAQPEEIDIAIAADRVQKATLFDVRRIAHSRAGLRTFVGDESFFCGYAPDADGFFWHAGLGGSGIGTSPAMSRMVAALAHREDLPAELAAFGLTPADFAPHRG